MSDLFVILQFLDTASVIQFVETLDFHIEYVFNMYLNWTCASCCTNYCEVSGLQNLSKSKVMEQKNAYHSIKQFFSKWKRPQKVSLWTCCQQKRAHEADMKFSKRTTENFRRKSKCSTYAFGELVYIRDGDVKNGHQRIEMSLLARLRKLWTSIK